MFNLHVVQAYHGDCLIVEYGDTDQPRYMLVDGGPKQSYEDHLRPELLKIRDKGGKLERIVVSHVCNDHIDGFVELFLNLREERIKNVRKTIDIKSIWLNQFSQTIGKGENFKSRLNDLFQRPLDSFSRNTLNEMNYSIARADGLINIFKPFNIPVNPETKNEVISVENLPHAIVHENLSIQIIGPDEYTLKKLREEWLEWIEKKEKREEYENLFFEAMSDRSYQNLSSIVLLLSTTDRSNGKRILLTGDARGDFIIKSLENKGFLENSKPFFVDILKLPHHGSERNVSKEFFEKVIADVYVVSACKHGKTDNPDFSTLEWIINSAEQRGEKVEIFVTNKNKSTEEILGKYGADTKIFRLRILDKMQNSAVYPLVEL